LEESGVVAPKNSQNNERAYSSGTVRDFHPVPILIVSPERGIRTVADVKVGVIPGITK
jgi:hypothetical protein